MSVMRIKDAQGNWQEVAALHGLPGTSVSITNITQSTEDDGYSVVTFSDGKQLRVKNGSKGSQGDPGESGGGSEGVFELIATITPEAGTSTVNFTKESDGTACKYKSAMVRMSAAGHSNSSKLYDGSVNIYFNSGNTQLGAALVSELRVHNYAQSATAIAHTICGSWFVYNHGASGSSYKQVTVFPRDSGKYTTKDCPYITGVKLWFSGEIKSVEGDVIEIWGVRA